MWPTKQTLARDCEMTDLIHQHIVRKIRRQRRYDWYLVWRSPVAKLILLALLLGALIAVGAWAIIRLMR